MEPSRAGRGLALAGVALVAIGVAVAVTGSVPPAVTFVCVGLGTSYATVGTSAAVSDARTVVSLWLAVLPAAVTAVVATLVAEAVGVLGTSNPVVPALVAGAFAAVTLPYALGTVARRLERWAVLALLLAATAPFLGVVVWAASNIDAEEGGLVLAFAVVAFVSLVPPAVPNYLLGRVVSQRIRGTSPPDTVALALAAVPFVLAFVSMLAMPRLVVETVLGPVVALLIVAGLGTIGVTFHRIPA